MSWRVWWDSKLCLIPKSLLCLHMVKAGRERPQPKRQKRAALLRPNIIKIGPKKVEEVSLFLLISQLWLNHSNCPCSWEDTSLENCYNSALQLQIMLTKLPEHSSFCSGIFTQCNSRQLKLYDPCEHLLTSGGNDCGIKWQMCASLMGSQNKVTYVLCVPIKFQMWFFVFFFPANRRWKAGKPLFQIWFDAGTSRNVFLRANVIIWPTSVRSDSGN